MINAGAAGVPSLEGRDPLADGAEVPKIGVLQNEIQWAWDRDEDTYGSTGWFESIRYTKWAGQSRDGLKWRKGMGERAKPYDGAPDTRPLLVDGVCNAWVDVLYAAFFGARVKTAPAAAKTLNAAQAAEWRTVISWMLNGPLAGALVDQVEFAAQLMETIGWCVLHPTWRREQVVKMQTLTMEEVFEIARRAQGTQGTQGTQGGNVLAGDGSSGGLGTAGPTGEGAGVQTGGLSQLLANAPGLIMDPALEEGAMELLRLIFPDMEKKAARRVVRELRADGEASFPVEAEGMNVPELNVLIPGMHFVLPPEGTTMGNDARWMPRRMFFSEQRLRQRAQEEGWNEAFVERVCLTKGQSLSEPTPETITDENMRDIEIFYVYARGNNEHGVPGMYCTVMSMHVGPGTETTAADYGKHELIDPGHDEYPFLALTTEVTGLRWKDARGEPEIFHTQQQTQKTSMDLALVREALTTVPPLQKKGAQASKLPPNLAPMGIVNNVDGGEWDWFAVPPGSPALSMEVINYIQKVVEDHAGIERGDTPVSRSATRKQRRVGRWLSTWGRALWQLSVMAYQNLSPEELTEILGRAPLLTVELLQRQRLTLWFEVRSMDSDWLDDMIKNVIQLLQVDTSGTIDRAKLVSFIMAYLDPALGEEVTLDKAGSAQQMFKEVRGEINSMRLGNKPMLRQNDPTAAMKLQFANQVLSTNPDYQEALKPTSPRHDPAFLENITTYMKNLQHNHQEMVTSKQQGRLGVADVGSGPVATGSEG